MLSADRKVAKTANQVEFLQSTPDGATLRLAAGGQPEAEYVRFKLVGLSAILSRVEKACGQTLEKSSASSKPWHGQGRM
jgi:hypothetical protein